MIKVTQDTFAQLIMIRIRFDKLTILFQFIRVAHARESSAMRYGENSVAKGRVSATIFVAIAVLFGLTLYMMRKYC